MDYAKQAADTLQNHTFVNVVDMDGLEVWKCRQPGSGSMNALDIVITNMAITITGDYDPVIFRVGARYGLTFLSREVDGYYCEKLDGIHRDGRVFCPERACEAVRWAIVNQLEGDDIEVPEAERGKEDEFARKLIEARNVKLHEPMGEVVGVDSIGMDAGGGLSVTVRLDEREELPDYSAIEELLELWDDIKRGLVEHCHQFYEIWGGLKCHDGEYPSVDKHPDNMMLRLYMVQFAARKIVEIKNNVKGTSDVEQKG